MNIRHVLPQPAMGVLPADPVNTAMTGVVNAAWNLAVQQAAAGHAVEIVAPGEGPPAARSIAGVRVHRLPEWRALRTSRYDFANLLPLLRFTMAARKVDVTHVHSNPYLVLRLQTRATVLHFQNSPLEGSSWYARAVSRADRVICCSRFILRQLTEAVPHARPRAHVVHNGVDFHSFAEPDRAAARTTVGVTGDQIVLLYVGRIGHEKGTLVLVDALRGILERGGPRPLLLIAGSGRLGYETHPPAWDDLRAYEELVRGRSRGLPVRFLGDVPRSQLPRLYRAADIFVCPSVYEEPFGMVNVEAAAAGLPTVASRAGGIPEAVIHGRTGLLTSPGDPQDLADALLHLLADCALRRRLGQTAQEAARAFDWRVLADQVAQVYERALERPLRYDPSHARS